MDVKTIKDGLKGVPLVTIAMLYGLSLEDNLKKFKKLFGELVKDDTRGWKPVLDLIDLTIKDHYVYSDNEALKGLSKSLDIAIEKAKFSAGYVKLLLSKKENNDFADDEDDTNSEVIMSFVKLTNELIKELSIYAFKNNDERD